MVKITDEKKKMRKGIQGITLVALVVTIVVLLILAGVSINLVLGNNGIIAKTQSASLETEISSIAEQLNFYATAYDIDSIVNQTEKDVLGNLQEKGIINSNNIIDTQKLLGKKTKYGNGTDKDVYKIEGTQVVYIDEENEITAYKEISIQAKNPFVTEWTVEAGDTIVLPIGIGYVGDNNFVVDYGDGSKKEKICDTEEALTQRPQHTYTKAGTYRISIDGKCNYFTLSSISEEYPNQLTKLTRLISWGEIEALIYDFYGATNMAGTIPSPYPKTFSKYEADSFANLFYNCSKINNIPGDLFKNVPNNISSFASTFRGCTSLTTIPEGLFTNTPNVTNFSKTFYGCNSLTTIPENLFANNENVTDFTKTFFRCNNISAIPEHIFDNNKKVTSFVGTFYDLQKIESVPKLWERTTENLDGTGCFGSCDKLEELNVEIPSPWAASL